MRRTGWARTAVVGAALVWGILAGVLAFGGVAAAEDEDVFLFRDGVLLPPVAERVPADADDGATVEPPAALTPRDLFINEMLEWIWNDNGKRRESTGSESPGQCRRYLVNVFKRFADGYRMAEYPKVKLTIPLKYKRVPDPPRLPGTQWLMDAPSDGNPFEEVSGFYFDKALSLDENRARCEAFLTHIQRGDILQMNGTWGPKASNSGNHTLIFRADYDPDSDVLLWSNSNMQNERASNGKRYGYVKADEERTITEFMSWILNEKNGATLYRLREDIILAPGK